MPSSALVEDAPVRSGAPVRIRSVTSAHMWIVVAGYQVVDPARPVMDPERLISVEGPACYFCDQPYSLELAARPCPGDRRG